MQTTKTQPLNLQCPARGASQIATQMLMLGVVAIGNVSLALAHEGHRALDTAAYSMLLDLPQEREQPVLREPGTRNTIGQSQVNQLYAEPAIKRVRQCQVDFNNGDALALSESSLWFDRVYVPWWQSCDNQRYVDLRPMQWSHFHVGFESGTVEPCFANEQAFPSHIDEEMNCTFVDIPTEPRTHLTTHDIGETLSLRMYNFNAEQQETFHLTQIRVLGNNSIDLCFNHSVFPAGEWKTAWPPEEGQEPGWYCWESIGPGYWNLAPWISNVAEVRISASDPSTFSIDDLKLEW